MTELELAQLARLELAGVSVPDAHAYVEGPDSLGKYCDGMPIPEGYKKCGGCDKVLKFYLYNVNNAAKTRCTGNCKACQKESAAKSYAKTKSKRDYKGYYQANKEMKQLHHKKYYEANKDKINAKQKEYNSSKRGKKVMLEAHARRRNTLKNNKGVPYKREWVIDRDTVNGLPECYLCGEPIKFEREIHMDHVVPVVLRGKDCFTNVACTHDFCNLRREKDARKLSIQSIELIIERSEAYMDAHPELFEKE